MTTFATDRMTFEAVREYAPGATHSPEPIASRSDARDWRLAIDEMLRWRTPNSLGDTAPSPCVLDAAIDFACDMQQGNQSPPSSIVPIGDERIAMEWNSRDVTTIVEVYATGEADYQVFHNGKLVVSEKIFRNPKSRKLELRG